MLALAIEQSTDTGSVAILNDARVTFEREWRDNRYHNQELFRIIAALVREAALDLGAVELFVVGLGPGSYTGLRTALAAMTALALPGRTRVFGVASAAALAWDIFREQGADSVAVVGDARRDKLWLRVFRRQNGLPAADNVWRLIAPAEVPQIQAAALVTADWERLGALLKAGVASNVKLLEGRRMPRAATVGGLALAKIAAGQASEPLAPIYLHPAVAAKRAAANR